MERYIFRITLHDGTVVEDCVRAHSHDEAVRKIRDTYNGCAVYSVGFEIPLDEN